MMYMIKNPKTCFWLTVYGHTRKIIHLGKNQELITLPETKIAPENGWLEDYLPFWGPVYFQGRLLLVSGSIPAYLSVRSANKYWTWRRKGHQNSDFQGWPMMGKVLIQVLWWTYPPAPIYPPSEGLIKGKPTINKPLIWPYFWGGTLGRRVGWLAITISMVGQ